MFCNKQNDEIISQNETGLLSNDCIVLTNTMRSLSADCNFCDHNEMEFLYQLIALYRVTVRFLFSSLQSASYSLQPVPIITLSDFQICKWNISFDTHYCEL